MIKPAKMSLVEERFMVNGVECVITWNDEKYIRFTPMEGDSLASNECTIEEYRELIK